MVAPVVNMLWSAPVQFVIYLVLLGLLIGKALGVGIAVMAFFLFVISPQASAQGRRLRLRPAHPRRPPSPSPPPPRAGLQAAARDPARAAQAHRPARQGDQRARAGDARRQALRLGGVDEEPPPRHPVQGDGQDPRGAVHHRPLLHAARDAAPLCRRRNLWLVRRIRRRSLRARRERGPPGPSHEPPRRRPRHAHRPEHDDCARLPDAASLPALLPALHRHPDSQPAHLAHPREPLPQKQGDWPKDAPSRARADGRRRGRRRAAQGGVARVVAAALAAAALAAALAARGSRDADRGGLHHAARGYGRGGGAARLLPVVGARPAAAAQGQGQGRRRKGRRARRRAHACALVEALLRRLLRRRRGGGRRPWRRRGSLLKVGRAAVEPPPRAAAPAPRAGGADALPPSGDGREGVAARQDGGRADAPARQADPDRPRRRVQAWRADDARRRGGVGQVFAPRRAPRRDGVGPRRLLLARRLGGLRGADALHRLGHDA